MTSFTTALALISAALFSVTLRPWGNGYAAPIAIAVLIAALARTRSPWQGGLIAFVAWLGLGIPSLEGIGVRLWWAFPALLAVLGASWFLFGALIVLLRNRAGEVVALVLFPLLFTCAEYLPSARWLFGDAGGALLAYSQADTHLRMVASWSGPSSVVLLLLCVGSALYLLVDHRKSVGAVLLGATLLASAIPAPGTVAEGEAETLPVAVIQGSQPDVRRLIAGYDAPTSEAMMNEYLGLIDAVVNAGAELVVLGETVLPFRTDANALPEHVAATLGRAPATIVGTLENSEAGWHNSAFTWRNGGLESIYRKQALVPIVEGSYVAGTSSQPARILGERIGVGICLDSVHASIVRSMVSEGARMLVFITDDTFAGSTTTPYTHLATAVLRAVETARTTMFVNESGPSAIIDPRGRIVGSLALGEAGYLMAQAELREGATPFVLLGDWLGLLVLVVSALGTAGVLVMGKVPSMAQARG